MAAPGSLETEAAVRAYLTGRWVLCSGAMMPEAPGLVIEADGAWHFLKEGEAGALVPDWTRAGNELELYEIGPEGWQLTLFHADGGEYMVLVGIYPGQPPRLSLTFHGWDTDVEGWYLHAE